MQRKHKLTSEEMLQRIGLYPLHHYVDLKTLAYAGHVQRVGTDRLPKIIRDGTLEGKNDPGRGHKTLDQCIKQPLARKKIEETEWKEVAVQKEQWRSKIREFTEGTSARITGKSRKKFVEAWVLHPDLLIGRQILKQFAGGKWHRGLVKSSDLDENTNEAIWQILYDDGDQEDFSVREMAGLLVNEESEDEDGDTSEISSSESGDSDTNCEAERNDDSDGDP